MTEAHSRARGEWPLGAEAGAERSRERQWAGQTVPEDPRPWSAAQKTLSAQGAHLTVLEDNHLSHWIKTRGKEQREGKVEEKEKRKVDGISFQKG